MGVKVIGVSGVQGCWGSKEVLGSRGVGVKGIVGSRGGGV